MNRKFLHLTSHNWRSLGLIVALALTLLALIPSSAQAQSDNSPMLTVLAESVPIRSGPDAGYPTFDSLPQGRATGIIGYNTDTGWWQVVSVYGSPGWVPGDETLVSVNETAIQQFIPPPLISQSPNLQSPISQTSNLPTFQSPNILVFQTRSGGPIYAINADGSNLRTLTTGMDPALSPDGQWVAFTRWRTDQLGALGSLSIINVDGTGERVLLNDAFNPRAPVWSPDGTQIALTVQHGGRLKAERRCGGDAPRTAIDVDVSGGRSGEREVCYTLPPNPFWGLRMVDVATGQFEDLPHEKYSYAPAWNPAQPWQLVYDGNRGLVSLDLNLQSDWPLTEDLNDRTPVFSPDGTKIAVSYRQDDHWEVHVINADGSGRVRLTATSYIELIRQQIEGQSPHSFNNASPVWSPDGSQIAFLSDRSGQWDIWVVNADGSGQRPLFPAGTLDGIPLAYNGVNEQVLAWR